MWHVQLSEHDIPLLTDWGEELEIGVVSLQSCRHQATCVNPKWILLVDCLAMPCSHHIQKHQGPARAPPGSGDMPPTGGKDHACGSTVLGTNSREQHRPSIRGSSAWNLSNLLNNRITCGEIFFVM